MDRDPRAPVGAFCFSPQFLPLPDSLTLLSGTSLNIALSGTDAGTQPGDIPGFYDFQLVGVSNVNLTNPHVQNPQLTAQVLDPISNRSMKITVKDPQDQIDGSMTLQLFEQLVPNTTQRIIDLANGTGNPPNGPTGGGPFYDGLTFQRVIKDFMIQGGDPAGDGTGGSGVKLDDEINAQLQFTSSGILAMANGGADTSDSQFFITNEPTRWLDFRYTILGFLTSGNDILQKIESVPTGANDKPVHDVVMQTVEVFVDGEDRTLRLFVPDGTTGTADVTVSISGDSHWDGTGDPPAPVLHTFHVTVAADTNNNLPFLGAIPTIVTTANTTKNNLQIPATDVEGDAITYDGVVTPTNANLTLTIDHATGATTLQTANNWAGVASVMVGVTDASAQSWDTQAVPVYVNPAKPTVELLASADTGPSPTDRITNPNLTQDHTLGIRVSGLASGAEVVLYADGTEIGRGTASSDSLILHSPTTFTWSDGTHSITAKQTLHNQTVAVGNTNTTVELASDLSDPLSVSVDTGVPWITSTPVVTAQRGHEYAYHVQSNEDPNVQYQLTSAPGGMLVDLQTGQITWTPSPTQPSPASVTVRVSDMAGNLADQSFQITMQTLNDPPVASPQQSVRVVSDTPKALLLTGDDGNVDVVQTLTYAIASQPSHGALSGFNPATGDVTYTPAAGYFGPDSFTFTVTDDDTAGPPGPLTSAPATVSLQVVPVNHPPTANPQSATTDENAAITLTLTGDDGDPQIQQTLSFLIVNQPSHGTAAILDANAGTVMYTPQPGYNGPDSFTFRTMDDNTAEPPFLTSDPATVSITVNRVNSPPSGQPPGPHARSEHVQVDRPCRQRQRPGGDAGPDVHARQPADPRLAHRFRPRDRRRDLHAHGRLLRCGQLHVHRDRRRPGGRSAQLDQPARRCGDQCSSGQRAADRDSPERHHRGKLIAGPRACRRRRRSGGPADAPVQPDPGTEPRDLKRLRSGHRPRDVRPQPVLQRQRQLHLHRDRRCHGGQSAQLEQPVGQRVDPGDSGRLPAAVRAGRPGARDSRPSSPDVAQGGGSRQPRRRDRFQPRPRRTSGGDDRLADRRSHVQRAAAVPAGKRPGDGAGHQGGGSVADRDADRRVRGGGLALLVYPRALPAASTEIAPSLITPPALSDLPAAAPASPNLGFQLGFGPSDLLGSQSFFTDPFGPPPNGSGDVPVETPPAKPGQRTGEQKNASQQGTGDTSESDEKKDKSLQQGQTGVTSPELNDAALEEIMEGEDGLELAAADADLLLAASEW